MAYKPESTTNIDLYIASTGNDANNGSSPALAVQTYARIEALLPLIYDGYLRIHFLDAGPFVVTNGLHRLPASAAGASPIQFLGTYAQDAAGNGGGIRTIAGGGVGTDSVQDSVGGFTPEYYRGAVLHRLSGANWRRYFVTEQTAAVFTLGLPWVNGGAPTPGDTFEVLFGTSQLQFDDVLFDLNGNTLICDGLVWNGAANPKKHWTFENGSVYLPGCLLVPQNGMMTIRNGAIRTFDQVIGQLQTTPFPVELPDLLGLLFSTGDLNIETDAEISACVSSPPVAGFDFVGDGGSTFLLDSILVAINSCYQQLNGSASLFKSAVGSTFKMTATGGVPMLVQTGAVVRITDVDLSGAPSQAISVQSGGVLYSSGLTGSGNGGYGIVVQGGTLIDDGTSSVTGASGDLLVNGIPLTWAQFQALGNSTVGVEDVINFGVPLTATNWAVNTPNNGRDAIERMASLLKGLNGDFPIPPLYVPNLSLWLPSEGIVNSAGKVATWTDESGRGWSFTQAVPANQPNYVAAASPNGKPGVSFDGIATFLNTTATLGNLISAAAYCIFYVVKVVAIHDPNIPGVPMAAGSLLCETPSGEFSTSPIAGPKFDGAHYTGAVMDEAQVPIALAQFYVLTHFYDGANLGVGLGLTAPTTSAAGNVDAAVLGDAVRLGTNYAGVPTFFFEGTICEIVAANGNVPQAHRNEIISYLGAKFGVAV